MSLRIRVAVLGCLLAAVLIAAAAAVLDTLHQERASRTEVRRRVQPAADAARSVLAGLVDQETGARGFVITGRRSYLEPYVQGQQETRTSLRRIAELTAGDPQIAAAVRRVRELARRWRNVGTAPEIAARRRGDGDRARRLVAGGGGKGLFDRLREEVDALQSLIDERVTRAAASTDAGASTLRRQLLGIGVLLLALGVAVLFLTRRWVLAPLRHLQEALRAVSAGELTRTIEPIGPPETRSLARDAERMRRRILDELRFSEGAREALEQRGPVVVGLRRELAAASTSPPAGLVAAGAVHPAEGILAGDWYDLLELPDGRVALLVVDVSGHGAEAGLVALRLKHVLSAALRAGLSPHRALRMAAADFDDPRDRFATGVIVVLDPASGRICWANAGHPAPLVVGQVEPHAALPATGPLLSVLGGAWEEHERVLRPGEIVFAYTDGLTEARGEGGDPFGEERLRDTLAEVDPVTPERALDAVLTAVRAHAREERRDDITIVAVGLAPLGAGLQASVTATRR